ncbi:partial Teichoic acids export ATP-binding protein TagH, partial [Patescibacteria group bacterium]
LFASFFHQGKTRQFKALEDINFEVYKGEFIGLIGRNGSGKSTLLKLIAGIYDPDKGGKIDYLGRLIPFLELGVGFNPELTGRENIFLNGTILGMTRKFLEERLDGIIEFAELRDFIDVPVKNYSSGMTIRLAFSIAVQTKADIYLLDEVLSVGDIAFQKKSEAKMLELIDRGATVIYVTQSINKIKELSDRVIYIKDHKVEMIGDPETVTGQYEADVMQTL